jgi:hypothetical protein
MLYLLAIDSEHPEMRGERRAAYPEGGREQLADLLLQLLGRGNLVAETK